MKSFKYAVLVLCLLLVNSGPLYCKARKQLSFSKPFDTTLNNGLRIILIEHHEQPAIVLRLWLKVGTRDDPADKKGLIAITSDLLEFGTMTQTEEEIEARIDQIGGNLSIDSGSSNSNVSFGFLSKDKNQAIELFADMIQNPAMPPGKLDWLKERYLNSVRGELANNYKQLYRHQSEVLFGPGNPLGMRKTVKSIKNIEVEDARSLYQKQFQPNRAILMAIGDFSNESMLSRLKESFADWQKKTTSIKADYQVPDKPVNGNRIITKPNMTQTFFSYSRLTTQTDPDDYFGFRLLTYILTSGPTSRLNAAVRQDAGKTYALWSSYEAWQGYGVFDIHLSTRNSEFLKTHLIVQAELKKLLREGISEADLNKAKAYYTGAIPLILEHPSNIAGLILKGIDRGIPLQEIRDVNQKYQNVTLKQANHLIQKYLDPDSLNLVVLGDREKIQDQLEKIGKFEERHFEDLLF